MQILSLFATPDSSFIQGHEMSPFHNWVVRSLSSRTVSLA
jgi:hypothetical protein